MAIIVLLLFEDSCNYGWYCVIAIVRIPVTMAVIVLLLLWEFLSYYYTEISCTYDCNIVLLLFWEFL